MNIELDGMPLIQHVRDPETGATKEIRSVYNIDTSERRRIAEHKVPGLEGGILKDLGRELVRISFDGMFYGEVAKDNLERLRSKLKLGKPVPFNADVAGAAEVTQVLIEELSIEDIGGVTNRYKYSIVLREYLEPPPPSKAPPSQGPAAKKAVKTNTDDAQASINYITGEVLDEEGNPIEGVDVRIKWDKGEFTVKTDADGIYRKDDLEPGKYTIVVDAEGFEDEKEEFEVGSGKA